MRDDEDLRVKVDELTGNKLFGQKGLTVSVRIRRVYAILLLFTLKVCTVVCIVYFAHGGRGEGAQYISLAVCVTFVSDELLLPC